MSKKFEFAFLKLLFLPCKMRADKKYQAIWETLFKKKKNL